MTAVAAPCPAVPLCAVDELVVLGDGELTATKRITAADPYLSGHYPGRPIYPGVFVIESVLQAARRYLGDPGLAIASVESVRLRAPLLPGDVLRLSLVFNPLPDGQFRVRAGGTRADGSAAASVELCCVPLRQRANPGPSEPTGVPIACPDLPPVRSLLPHRPPILLVDAIREHRTGEIVTEYVVRETEPCYRSSVSEALCYPDTLVLESFVQAAATLFVLDGAAALPAGGMLVLGSARGVRFGVPVLPGQSIRHRVTLDRLTGDTALLRGTSTVHGRPCLGVTTVAVAVRANTVVAS